MHPNAPRLINYGNLETSTQEERVL
jgi:hypothetical protein